MDALVHSRVGYNDGMGEPHGRPEHGKQLTTFLDRAVTPQLRRTDGGA